MPQMCPSKVQYMYLLVMMIILLAELCRIVRAFLIEEQKIVTGMLAVNKAQPKK